MRRLLRTKQNLLAAIALFGVLMLPVLARSEATTAASASKDVFTNSSCAGCHGQAAMGGLGPPLVKTKLTYEEFLKVIREGKGMMPAIPADQVSDEQASAMYKQVQEMPWIEEQIPIAYKVGQYLSTQSVSRIFLYVFGFAGVMVVMVLVRWLKAAGIVRLMPYVNKFGAGKALAIALKSLVVDGLFVSSLYRRDKFRWVMHGLMLYGFLGLMFADILMSVFNPSRLELPLMSPLKLLPMVSGIAVLTGILYVMYRYKKDPYIDNGVTIGRDFLFVTLLFHTIVSGFLTVLMKRAGVEDWVMTVYLYHLVAMAVLIVSAPFTRFQHAFVVPTMIAMTRVVDAISESGVDIGFSREPSPGRHHKTERIIQSVLDQVEPDHADYFKVRYYP